MSSLPDKTVDSQLSVSSTPVIELLELGEIGYAEALELQRARHRALIDGSAGSVLILCEHPAVITRGRSSRADSIVSSSDLLVSEGVDVHEVERGGDVTFHGPGQLVAYPLLRLEEFRKDVGWYMRQLEEVVICSLADCGVSAIRVPGKTGVWADEQRKIASMGVKISRWCTLHGVAVNVLLESESGFRHLIPCGLDGISITSLERESGARPRVIEYRQAFIAQFERIFSVLLRASKG